MSLVLLSLSALLLTTLYTHGHELAIPCGHQDNCLCYNVIGLISCINRNLVDFHDDFLEVDRQVAIYLDLKFNNLTRFSFQESMWPELIEMDLRENPIDCAWLSNESWREMAKTDCIIAHEEWQDLNSEEYEDYNSELYGDLWQTGLTPENDGSPDVLKPSSGEKSKYSDYEDLPGGGWTPYKRRHKTSGDSLQKGEKSVGSGTLSLLIFLSFFGCIFMVGVFLVGLRAAIRKVRGKRQPPQGHVNTIVRDGNENGRPFVYSNMTDREYVD